MRVQEAVSETADGPTHWPACMASQPELFLIDLDQRSKVAPCRASAHSTLQACSTVRSTWVDGDTEERQLAAAPDDT